MASNGVDVHVSLVEVGMEGFGRIEEVGYLQIAGLNGQVLGDLPNM